MFTICFAVFISMDEYLFMVGSLDFNPFKGDDDIILCTVFGGIIFTNRLYFEMIEPVECWNIHAKHIRPRRKSASNMAQNTETEQI